MNRRAYLRLIFSSESEIPFIKMNIKESWDLVDAVVIYEANRTHTGEARDLLFPRCKAQISQELLARTIYVADDLAGVTQPSVAGNEMHENERIIRARFAEHIGLRLDDIVIAVDADEVIRRQIYPLLLRKLEKFPVWRLPLNQFFYRMNYLWSDITFFGPNACIASHYIKQRTPKWRDEGCIFPVICGSHFSWQLSIEQMIHKLQTYAHRDLYGHLASREILEAAINEKRYPFEPERSFNIVELDVQRDYAYYPASFYEYIGDFYGLLP